MLPVFLHVTDQEDAVCYITVCLATLSQLSYTNDKQGGPHKLCLKKKDVYCDRQTRMEIKNDQTKVKSCWETSVVLEAQTQPNSREMWLYTFRCWTICLSADWHYFIPQNNKCLGGRKISVSLQSNWFTGISSLNLCGSALKATTWTVFTQSKYWPDQPASFKMRWELQPRFSTAQKAYFQLLTDSGVSLSTPKRIVARNGAMMSLKCFPLHQ